MVGCCNIGPCKKRRTYEFNNPGYEANKAAGTYRQSQLLEGDEEAKANGAANLKSYESQSGDTVDGDPGIKGVVAVEIDSNGPSVDGDSNSSPGKRDSNTGKDSKRSSKRSSSSRKGSKREPKHSDIEDDHNGITNGETSVVRVRSSVHNSESGERSSKMEDIEAGATPYPDGDTEHGTTTTYTTVIRHYVDGTGDDDVGSDTSKRISNVSSRSSSTPHVISTYDPSAEGHFHSEHHYTVELTPEKRISSTSDGRRNPNQEQGSEIGSVTTERSSVMVTVPSEAEELDNIANKMAEDLQDESEEWHTVTEVTETVTHINSPVEIGDTQRYSSNNFAV